MSKRRPLDIATTDELTKDLKASNGAGMNAFFASQTSDKSPALPENDPKGSGKRMLGEVIIPQLHPEQTNDRTNERTTVRIKTRHSFDIFKDQLEALMDMQYKTTKKGEKKPSLGELVQAALDKYLNTANERTNDRSNKV